MFNIGEEFRNGDYGFLTWYFNISQEQLYVATSISDFLNNKEDIKPNPYHFVTKNNFARVIFQNVQIEKIKRNFKVYDLTSEIKVNNYNKNIEEEINKESFYRAQILSVFYNHEKDKVILNHVKKFNARQTETQKEFNGIESFVFSY